MMVLTYVLGVLMFVVGVAASIGLHELGHLVPGKLFDVKVTQYFIGFGRTVWSRRRGETEYGVKAVPLGGYVKLVGHAAARPGRRPDVGAQLQHRSVRAADVRCPGGRVRAGRARTTRTACSTASRGGRRS